MSQRDDAIKAALGFVVPPRKLPQVIIVEDDGAKERKPDKWDEEYQASPDVEMRAEASAEERFKLFRPTPAPDTPQPLPRRIIFSRPSNEIYCFNLDGSIDPMPLTTPAEMEAVNARIAAVIDPRFRALHGRC